MDANGNKPLKTRIHKPGISRKFAATNVNYAQDTDSRRSVRFARRDSSPGLGVNSLTGLPFRRDKRTTLEPNFAEVPSYNLWKSRADCKSSLRSYFSSRQRKASTSSCVFVPSVVTREIKGLRNYSAPLQGTLVGNHDERTTERAVYDVRGSDSAFKNEVNVFPTDEFRKHNSKREHSGVSHSPSYCDSVSAITCSSTEISSAKYNDRQSYYDKNDSIKRWLSEVE